jgi:hypothetical protein
MSGKKVQKKSETARQCQAATKRGTMFKRSIGLQSMRTANG